MGLFGSSNTETASTTSSGMAGSDPKSFVDGLIKSEKVVIFSKSYCPFCKKAKSALQQELGSKFTVVELDERQDGDAIQDYLNQITGGRSVPRVFVSGKFIGGGDDTVAKQQSGELKKILQQAGAL
ncbi:hypothetical protein ABBQ38_014039 [Trebouxia sp. C0009 RCD-2024]